MKKMMGPEQQFNLTRHNLTKQTCMRIMLATAICVAFNQAQALPMGEQVQAGNANFVRDAQSLNINQTSQQAIVNWQSFGIAANEAVRLYQPNQGVALFRVVGSDPSQIFGSLSATGSLFLTNPNGVLFAPGSQVNVGNLLATTMQISDQDFLAKHYQFSGDSNASVINQGVIRTEDGGYIALLGSAVENSGTLQTNSGSVVLGSAQSALLDIYGDGLVQVKLSGDALNAVINQSGNIMANGGAVQLAANARTAALNVDGMVQANSLVNRNGVIRLEGGKNTTVQVSGNINAKGNSAGLKGGEVTVTGERVALLDGASMDVSGRAGGGKALIGGDYQGKNASVQNAERTYIAKTAIIKADALDSGDGGNVVVWANDITRYYGSITAKGGINGGNGGCTEVSGKRLLNFLGNVDLSATDGVGGNLLLDPLNITINNGADTNTAGFTPPGDITEAFADDAGLNSIFRVNAGGSFSGIAAGSTITLQATNDITVASAFNVATATGTTNNSLVLQANNNININAAVTTTGTGSINFTADADSSGAGNLAIGANITSQAGGMTLAGAAITRSVGNIASTGATDGNAGNISITSTGTTNLGAATVTASGGTASAGSAGRNGGAITINAAGFTAAGAITASGSNGNGANTNGGNAGSVNITSTNGISMGAVTATGGNAGTGNANGGNAGVIAINNSTAGTITVGAIASRTGNAIGTGAGGTAASVAVNNTASGNLSTGAITTSGNNNGNGGSILLSTVIGNINSGALASSGGTALTGNIGKNAGAITINAGGNYTTTTIAANGSAGVGTDQSGGNAANISITANSGVTTTTIGASGGNSTATNGNGGNGANIGITNNGSGNIATTTLTARNGNAAGTGNGGTAEMINVTNSAAAGNITTTTLSTAGGTKGLGGNIALTALGNISVNSTINSSGGATVTGNAGRNAGVVNINAGGNVVTGAITATGGAGVGTNQNGGNGGAVTLNSGTASTITLTNITTSGGARTGTGTSGNGANINVMDNALLSANTTIAATAAAGGGTGGNITWGGRVNSLTVNRTLAVNTNGASTFNSAVGNTLVLTSLTTDANGTTVINGGAVTTTGTQTYNDAVTLGASTSLNTTNSGITFASSVNASGQALTLSTGTGNITATNVANNFANVAITSANNVSLRDANAIQLGISNMTGTYALQTVGTVTQNGAVAVGGTTTLNAGAANDITLNNSANNFNAVAITSGRDVTLVDANAMTVNTSSVRTISARTLSNNLTLGGNITAMGTGSGTSITLASAQNFLNPGNSTLTPGAGSRWLVYSGDPANDTRGANLITAHDFKQYNTAFGGGILGTGDGLIYTLAPIITAMLSGAANKIYDVNTTASIGGITLGQTGAVDGDTVNLSALTSATYDNKNVGAGKTVTSNTLSITSATNGVKPVFGYQLASTTASGNVGTITPANLSVTGQTANNKVYDATTNATLSGGVLSGVLGADVVNLVTGTGSFADKNVGNAKTVTVAGSGLSGPDAGNYTVTDPMGLTANITFASLTITGQTANNKVYDATTNATLSGGVLSGVLGADVVNLVTGTGSFADKNVGNAKTVTVAGSGLSGLDTGNYTVTDPMGLTANITPADITAVNGITVNNKTYDATTVATINTGVATFTGVLGVDSLNVATATGNFSDKNAGTGKTVNITGISLGGTDAGNYNLTSTTTSTMADIATRAITITANPSQNKVVGNVDPLPFIFTVGGLGLVGGDTLSGALSRVAGEAVGNYAINQGSLDAGSNYALSYFGNDFSILAVPIINNGDTGNPRSAAGLVDLNPMLGNYTNQQLFVLNVGLTAAGNDSTGNQEACEGDPELLAKDKEFILMLNYGLKLPKGVSTSCDKASI